MKIGYPCLNYTIGGQANKTFRLASYSDERFLEAAGNNIAVLERILRFNIEKGLLFFRISSEILPFASHPVLKVDWQKYFRQDFVRIGSLIRKHVMRISMHPDQFVLINSPRRDVVESGIRDLLWHTQLLDALGLDDTAKVQIHVGGIYGDREAAIKNFVREYLRLPEDVRRRLAVENDDKCFPLADCLRIHEATGVPVIFDNFHHECLNRGEKMAEALKSAALTWQKKDGLLMTDYSSQQPGAVKGKHIESIDVSLFTEYLSHACGFDFDIMLEIKDKEKSALKALDVLRGIR